MAKAVLRGLDGQLELAFELGRSGSGRGGVRSGAGRKAGSARPLVRHRARERHHARHPVHVVMRSRSRSLRRQYVFPTLRIAFARATRVRKDFRITQFSVQGDHLHFIVEADNHAALSRGVQGLSVRIARSLNRLLSRSGKFWADRFFSRELRTPRTVRSALAYVLNNFRKHRQPTPSPIDPYSSAPYFAHFSTLRGRPPKDFPPGTFVVTPAGVPPLIPRDPAPITSAKTWLGRDGWQRAGAITLAGFPGRGSTRE